MSYLGHMGLGINPFAMSSTANSAAILATRAQYGGAQAASAASSSPWYDRIASGIESATRSASNLLTAQQLAKNQQIANRAAAKQASAGLLTEQQRTRQKTLIVVGIGVAAVGLAAVAFAASRRRRR